MKPTLLTRMHASSYSPKPKDNTMIHLSQFPNILLPSASHARVQELSDPTAHLQRVPSPDNIRMSCGRTTYLAPGKLKPNPGTAGGVATATGSGLTTCW
jgi:hypothetical protein